MVACFISCDCGPHACWARVFNFASTSVGSVTYWNAYVAGTQMHGAATFFDARFNNKDQYPISAKSGSGNTRNTSDRATAKLAALHFYPLSIPAPKAPAGSYDKVAFERARRSSMVRRSARPVTFRLSLRSQGRTCMRPRRSVSTRSRLTARRPTCTVRPLWQDFGRIRKEASSTTVALPP